jgi:hypothetical protein
MAHLPNYGAIEAVFEIVQRLPVQFVPRKGGIDGVEKTVNCIKHLSLSKRTFRSPITLREEGEVLDWRRLTDLTRARSSQAPRRM